MCQNQFILCGTHVFDKLSNEETGPYDDTASETPSTKCGSTLLQFFQHFSSNRGKNFLQSTDSYLDDFWKTFEHRFKGPKQFQLSQSMLFAYHSLVYCGNVHNFLDIPNVESDHMTMSLPRQISSQILFAEVYIARSLESKCKATHVFVRRQRYQNAMGGLLLEAWGDSDSLSRVREEIRKMESMSVMFVKGGASISRPWIFNSYHTVFENCFDAAATLNIRPYKGRCQPEHDRKSKQVPVLEKHDISSTFDRIAFVNFVQQQIDFINEHNDNNLYGTLKCVISYGTCYLINCTERILTVNEYEEKTRDKNSSHNAGMVNRGTTGQRRDAGRRGGGVGRRHDRSCRESERQYPKPRGEANSVRYDGKHGYWRRNGRSAQQSTRQNREYLNTKSFIHRTFIPSSDIKISAFEDFLKKNNFIPTVSITEFRVSIKMNVFDEQTSMDGVLVLDERLRFKHFDLPDTKWLVVDVVRNRQSGEELEDFRFKIQSRVTMVHAEVIKHVDCVELLENADVLLNLHPTDGVIAVHRDYIDRVKFLRRKNLTIYKHNGNPYDRDRFLCGLKIPVNRGIEYTRPTGDGIFTIASVDAGRIEVTVLPEMPDFQKTKECKEFLENVWNFSRELGSRLR